MYLDVKGRRAWWGFHTTWQFSTEICTIPVLPSSILFVLLMDLQNSKFNEGFKWKVFWYLQVLNIYLMSLSQISFLWNVCLLLTLFYFFLGGGRFVKKSHLMLRAEPESVQCIGSGWGLTDIELDGPSWGPKATVRRIKGQGFCSVSLSADF